MTAFFIGVFLLIILGAVVFVIWLAYLLLRGVGRLVLGPPQPQMPWPPKGNSAAFQEVRCLQQSCMTLNPPGARYCRRCGQPLDGPQIGAPTSH